jgi:DNA-binding NtrC family response regulator
MAIRETRNSGRVTIRRRLSPAAQPSQPQGGVLIVDDDVSVRACLRACLEHGGFQVWVASAGPEALELCRQHATSIAVTLIAAERPGRVRTHTLTRLLKLHPALHCFFMIDHRETCAGNLLRRHAGKVLVKPFDITKLLGLLHQLCRPTGQETVSTGSERET